MKRRRGLTESDDEIDPGKPKERKTDISKWQLDLYKQGRLASTDLLKGAQAESASSSSSAPPSDLARRMDKHNRDPKNAARDIDRFLNKNIDLPEPYIGKTTFWNKKTSSPFEGDIDVIPIHEVIADVVDKDLPAEYCTFIASQHRLDAALSEACLRAETPRTSRTADLSLWGDFAQYDTRDSLCLLVCICCLAFIIVVSGLQRLRNAINVVADAEGPTRLGPSLMLSGGCW